MILLAILMLLAPVVAGAQVSGELRAGGAIGNHAPAAAGLETIPGLSLSGTALFMPRPWLAAYASVARSTFGCEEGFCSGRDVSVRTMSLGAGVRVYPLAWAWLQAGAINLSATVSASGSEEPSTGALGYEAGAGLRFPMGPRMALVPAVLYRTGFEDAAKTTVLAGELGVQFRLR